MGFAGVKVIVACAQQGGIRIERAAPHTSEAVSHIILFFVIVNSSFCLTSEFRF
jgi:hypothetical protein